MRPPHPVISSGGSMLHENTVKNRYSYDESRNLSRGREYRAFQLPQLRCSKCTPSAFGIFPRRGGGKRVFRCSRGSQFFFTMKTVYLLYETTHPVISSGGNMLHEDIAKNRYSFDESRNLSCAREYRAFQNPSVACGASIGTPPPQAVPLPSKEGRLGCTATAKPRGLNVSPNSLSLEMTIDGKRHIGEDGIHDVRDHPAPSFRAVVPCCVRP